VTFSDKLSRLQSEFTIALDIASELVTREVMKKEVLQQTQQVWDHRFIFSELKRKFPSLSTKEDDDLLVDKERPPKKIKQEGYVSLSAICCMTDVFPKSHEPENPDGRPSCPDGATDQTQRAGGCNCATD
jgi:hypothetical protein